VLLQVENHSHTRLEMPIVADVDNDGNAEIVFIENAHGGGTTQGIRIWGDKNDSWVPTRRIWNQHSYHVTNVAEDGAIPMNETANWLAPTTSTISGKMNNFRQNLPEFDAFAAPDLTVTVAVVENYCPNALGLSATVCNDGAVGVGVGVPVTFFDNKTQTPIACVNGQTATTKPLAPGKCQVVTCEWAGAPYAPQPVDVRACVDNEGYECSKAPSGGNNECKEGNNQSNGQGTGCKQPT
jgi:hypothetical protein